MEISKAKSQICQVIYTDKNKNITYNIPMSNGKKITKTELEHIARLARIKLNEEDINRFLPQLDTVLEYLDKLKAKDTSAVPVSYQVTQLENVLRIDKAGPCLSQKQALSNAPKTEDGYFVVPATIKK